MVRVSPLYLHGEPLHLARCIALPPASTGSPDLTRVGFTLLAAIPPGAGSAAYDANIKIFIHN